MPKRALILKKLREALDPERFEHSLRVERIALALARRHRVSAPKAGMAALLHDYARKYRGKELIRQARAFKLKIDPISEFEPKLLHAELGALLARKDFGITSPEILDAIRKHTVGAPGMSRLEKIVYLADHIEEGRSFSGVDRIRKLAVRDLNRAVAESASGTLKYLLEKGLPVHPGTIATRTYYILKS